MTRFHFTEKETDYDLSLFQSQVRQKQHVLIVFQSVDSRDLSQGQLLSEEVMPTFQNLIAAIKERTAVINPNYDPFSYTVVNFNARRHLHLSLDQQESEEKDFARRLERIIKKIKPTKILVWGDRAMKALVPHANLPLKRGRIFDYHGIPIAHTLDFTRVIDKGGINGNLLGYIIQHSSYLLSGNNPTLQQVKVKPVYVDTVQKFDKLMEKLRQTKRFSLDTETRSLGVYSNKIFMIQFAFEEQPDRGFVVPLEHPMSPFTIDERRYMKRQLQVAFKGDRKFWRLPYTGGDLHPKHRLRKICSQEELPELITFNGQFDLRILRTCLRIPYIPFYLYEVRAGEHLLDENLSELKIFGTPAGGLAYVAASYGIDFYQEASFSKNERATCGAVEPSNKDLLRYCACDVQSLLAIRKGQLIRASHYRLEGKSYKAAFLRHMRFVMGETEHQLSKLRQDGSHLDIEYLKYLTSREHSPLVQEMAKLEREFRAYSSVKQVNTALLNASGFRAMSVFDNVDTTTEVFRLSKPDHRIALFIDHLGLDPLTVTAQGKPQIDKEFIDAYRTQHHEVDSYASYQELDKLYGTYVRGWLKRLRSTVDGLEDKHLRPDYTYMNVATGRLASYDPSLQVIPQRSKTAKTVKRAFITEKGKLLVRFDYSAHEVRVWSIISGDQTLASAFRMGQKLRQKYIQDPSEENKKAIKLHGDLHILNVKRFFNRIVDKDHPLRDAIKAVVFGAIYGKGAKTLGEDTKLPEIREQKSIISAELDKERPDQAVIEAANNKIAAIREEDRTPFAQDILDRMFREFKRGASWLRNMESNAESRQMVYSPIGRVRHLYASLIEDQSVIARQVRRGVNAPIQGLASEIGTVGSRKIETSYYYELPVIADYLDLEEKDILEHRFNRLVHDASYFAVPYETVIPFIHILQYEATYGVTEDFDRNFGLKFTIEPEIEVELSAEDSSGYKWDWSANNLVDCIASTIQDADKLGLLEGSKYQVFKTVMRPWVQKDIRDYLQENYPLLGVQDLNQQINEAVQYAKKKSLTLKAA